MRGRFCLAVVLVLCASLLTTIACDTGKVTIAKIINTPPEFEGEVVTVAGEYRGWQAENGYGPPVTRSDWIIQDDTGWIYVTGENPELDPVEDIGTPIEVRGIVRVTGEDIPYIEAESVEVKN